MSTIVTYVWEPLGGGRIARLTRLVEAALTEAIDTEPGRGVLAPRRNADEEYRLVQVVFELDDMEEEPPGSYEHQDATMTMGEE